MERWPPSAASMSAVVPRPLGRSTLAPRFSSSLTISSLPYAAAACSRPKAVGSPDSAEVMQSASTSPPLRTHLTTFCSSPRSADLRISRDSEAAFHGLARVRWVDWRGGGRLRRRGVLPEKRRDSHVSLAAHIRAVTPLLDCRSGLAECCSRTSRMKW